MSSILSAFGIEIISASKLFARKLDELRSETELNRKRLLEKCYSAASFCTVRFIQRLKTEWSCWNEIFIVLWSPTEDMVDWGTQETERKVEKMLAKKDVRRREGRELLIIEDVKACDHCKSVLRDLRKSEGVIGRFKDNQSQGRKIFR